MPLDAQTLAAAMKAAAAPKEYTTPPDEAQAKTDADEAMENLAAAIVDHITNNLDVTIPANTYVASATGQVVAVKNPTATRLDIN